MCECGSVRHILVGQMLGLCGGEGYGFNLTAAVEKWLSEGRRKVTSFVDARMHFSKTIWISCLSHNRLNPLLNMRRGIKKKKKGFQYLKDVISGPMDFF